MQLLQGVTIASPPPQNAGHCTNFIMSLLGFGESPTKINGDCRPISKAISGSFWFQWLLCVQTLCFWTMSQAVMYSQVVMYLLMNCFIFGQQKYLQMVDGVLSSPKCPPIGRSGDFFENLYLMFPRNTNHVILGWVKP